MSFRKTVFRLAVGFVAGTATGWVVHENPDRFDSFFDRWRSGVGKNSGGKLTWSGTPKFKVTSLWDENWDQRDPKFLEESRKNHKLPRTTEAVRPGSATEPRNPTATRHLFLIRHGQYNVDGEMDTSRTLTDLGIQQAEFTGQRLRDLEFPYTILIHSSMTRARQTADAIRKLLPEIPVMECELLREGAPCPPEPPLRNWKPDYKDGARIEAAFRKYFHRADPTQKEDSYEVIVCHANVIRYFVCRALQLPPEAWLRISLNHGSITSLAIRPSGRVVLRSLGETGYMPKKSVTVV